ncbi:hypothetical protein [Devosia indica]|uniref:hypothetical protein n=1 Tax=Devosia indica TaxID=2079253 RepID=UPI0018E533CE|nr:hypothetical protein [Devosia indica]
MLSVSVLSGETRGRGGNALARHLLSGAAGQRVRVLEARFLAGQSLHTQLRELVAGAAGARTDRPVLHVHIDPPPGWDRPDVIGHWLKIYEAEFGLEEQSRMGVLHQGKGGSERLHAHVLYSLVRQDGRIVDLKNSYRRREKISTITAFELGLPMPPIPRPRSVHRALLRDGRVDVADWMLQHCSGLHAPMRVAEVSPSERHIAERTGQHANDVPTILARLWPASGPYRFRRALQDDGLVLAKGTAGPVIIDGANVAHSLSRELRKACRKIGKPPPRAVEVKAFLGNMPLPTVAEVRRARAKMKTRRNPKAQILGGITGEQIVDEFGNRTQFVRKGPPHRIFMRDGGWVLVDPIGRRLVVSGPAGDADTLAEKLATLEPFDVERQESRRPENNVFRLKAVRPGRGRFQDRIEWWTDHGQRPELQDDGISIIVGGTVLFDRGNEIETSLPPSTEALDLIAAYAAEHWNGGLELSGPPGARDWPEADKARLWWACMKAGVVFHGYNPPPSLVRRWEAENAGQPTGAAAAVLKPSAGGHKTKEKEDTANRASAIEGEVVDIQHRIDAIKSEWKSHGRDQDWIERMRAEIDRLEDLKTDLLGSLSPQDRQQRIDYPRLGM